MQAFMIRDFQLRISYRLAFFLRVLSILIIVTIAYYVSQIFLGKAQLASWRDPLAAWITGLAVLNYFMTNFRVSRPRFVRSNCRARWRVC